MKKSIALALSVALISGCATVHMNEHDALATVGSLDTYTKCAAADVVTTAIGLGTHTMAEGNPLTRALAIKAFGAVGGPVVAVAVLSVAGYYALKAINKPVLTAAASILTCGAAIRNLGIIARAK